MIPSPVEVEAPLRLGLRLVGALNAATPGVHEREGVGRQAVSQYKLRTATCSQRWPWSPWCCGSRSYRWPLPPKTGQGPVAARGTVGGAHGKRPCRIPGSSRACARPRRCASAYLLPCAHGGCSYPCRSSRRLIRELRSVVRSEAFDGVPDVGQEFHRCRGHIDRTLALESVDPSMRVALSLNRIRYRAPPAEAIFLGPARSTKTRCRGGHPRGCRRRHRRAPTLRLHAPTAGKQGPRQLDVMLPGRLA